MRGTGPYPHRRSRGETGRRKQFCVRVSRRVWVRVWLRVRVRIRVRVRVRARVRGYYICFSSPIVAGSFGSGGGDDSCVL